MPNKIDNGTISHRNRAARHSLSEGLSSMRLMVGKYVVIGGNMQPRSKGGAGRAAQLQTSGSPTTSPAWTGRSRKGPPPIGYGIISPSRATSPVQAGSPPRPAQQAAGASPLSRRTTPRHRHPTETISKKGADDLKLTTPTNGRDDTSMRTRRLLLFR